MTDIARLQLDVDTRKLKQGERDLESFQRQSRETAGEVDKASAGMVGAFKRVGGALVAAGLTTVLFEFGKRSAQVAIDAQEMESAFGVVFGNMADDVRAWAEATGDAMGRSTQEIQRGALAFQELFGKALAPEQAAELSKRFAVLTQDLASFKNLSNEVAQQKLFSGLVGEAEPLRAVGVFLSETAVQAKAAELGLSGVNGVLTDQEKIVARAAIIQEQLAQASGDVIRTSDSAANQLKTYNAAVEELQVAIGTRLLPTLTPLITGAANVANAMAEVAQSGNIAGVSLGQIGRTIVTVASAWAAYRVTLLAAQVATLLMNSALAFNVSVIASTRAALGTAAAAQTAFSVATTAAANATRGLTAALVANPFTAVAAAVGILAGAFIGLANAQAQARAETNNLIVSLRAAAQARSADFSSRRAELQGQLNQEEARLRQLRASAANVPAGMQGGLFGAFTGTGSQRTNEALAAQTRVVSRLRLELGIADDAYVAAGKAAESMVVPTAQAAQAISATGGAASAAKAPIAEIKDEVADLAAQYRNLAIVAPQAGVLGDNRLLGFDATMTANDFGLIGGFSKPFDEFDATLGDTADNAETQATRIAESFAQMSRNITSSLQGLANSIQSGNFLGILGGVLDLFTSLGSAGVFGKGLQGRLNAPSFDGGGYTGSGSRSGGLDGKGGFLAMLHPNESVIDHHRGQSKPANDVTVRVDVGIDPRSGNVLAFVDNRIVASAPIVANAGAQQAQAQMARSNRRRVR